MVTRFRLTNLGSENVTLGTTFTAEDGESGELSRIQLVDSANREMYFVLRGTDGSCMCTLEAQVSLDAGTSMTGYAYFPAPPKNVKSVTMLFPYIRPFFNVPIGSREEPIQSGQLERRPTQVDAASPKVLPIIARSESLDGASDVKQGAKETTVSLASDVLFKLNESKLTPKAKGEIRAVAKRINQSTAQSVRIDGYTDSSGSPEINEPLSRKRAQSVKNTLQPLVTRPGVSFKTEGHGADDPVASNGTAEGRQQNRRVTVTFKS